MSDVVENGGAEITELNPAEAPAEQELADGAEKVGGGQSGKLEDLIGDLDETARTAILDQVQKARKEAASYRRQLREAQPAIDKVKELEEAKLSAEEKASKKAREAEEKYNSLAADLLRERVARRHAISDDLVDFLTATDEEGLEDQATRLAALASASKSPKLPTKPADGQGGKSTDKGADLSPDALFKSLRK